MKRLILITFLSIIGLAAVLGMPCTGCTAPILPGQDPVVVTAERSTAIAFDTVDAFLKFDNDNREILRDKAPEIHAFAESLRAKNPDGTFAPSSAAYKFREARRLTRLYEATKSAADGKNATDSVTAVEELARQARLALLQAQAVRKDI